MIAWDRLILLAPLFAMAISFHEYAHAWMADRLGDPGPRWAGRLTLNPLKHLDLWGTLMLLFIGIGFAKPVMVDARNFRDPVRDMMRVALVGPVANLILAVVFAVILRTLGPALGPVWDRFLFQGVWLNVALAFFNFLPIPPLDGSRIVSAFVGWRTRYFLAQMEPYGFLVLILLSYAGLLRVLVFAPTRLTVRLLVGV